MTTTSTKDLGITPRARDRVLLTVIILNYNGHRWLERCLESLLCQKSIDKVEVIVADNCSTDGSGYTGQRMAGMFPRAVYIEFEGNLGFCGGNNEAARQANGDHLLFLNNDTWLEAECLERILAEVVGSTECCLAPQVLDYDSNRVQSWGGRGFDIMGFPVPFSTPPKTGALFSCYGCAFVMSASTFWRLGGFDAEFFMYGEEHDLFWRLRLSGGEIRLISGARIHHRGEANANPAGGTRIVERRTTAQVRFLANRNNLLGLLKNAQHVLLITVVINIAYLLLESGFWLLISRNWIFVREAYFWSIVDLWKRRAHILSERRRIRKIRQRSDWWFLRFFTWRLNRWSEYRRTLKLGLPHIS